MMRASSLRRRNVAEFADQGSADATASVRLQLHPGTHLSRASIAGIRSFVAASVTGLDPARVTILDDRGVALSGDTGGNDDATALQTSLQSALDDALGAGVAIVRVHAEYASSENEQRDVRRAPLGNVSIAREASTESFDGQGRRYEKNDEHDDRGSDVHESVSRLPRGSLTRMTTAIFVDAQTSVSTRKRPHVGGRNRRLRSAARRCADRGGGRTFITRDRNRTTHGFSSTARSCRCFRPSPSCSDASSPDVMRRRTSRQS